MIVTVGDASPKQARGHIGDSCVKWKHLLSDVFDIADQTGTVRGRIERVKDEFKALFVSIGRFHKTLKQMNSQIHNTA